MVVIVIQLSPLMQRLCNQRKQVIIKTDTIEEALLKIGEQFPAFHNHLWINNDINPNIAIQDSNQNDYSKTDLKVVRTEKTIVSVSLRQTGAN